MMIKPMGKEENRFFTDLYQKFKPLMFSQALRYTDDLTAAEDIVYESLSKLLDKYDTLSALNRNALASYIVCTIRSVAINRYRKERREGEYANTQSEAAAPSAEDVALQGIFSEPLASAWPLLSEDDQCLLERKYILGMNTDELAKVYSCTPAYVRVKLLRARNRARSLLMKLKEGEPI
jgi:RNA polymerase sigma-70 factor (ECF subfamily)